MLGELRSGKSGPGIVFVACFGDDNVVFDANPATGQESLDCFPVDQRLLGAGSKSLQQEWDKVQSWFDGEDEVRLERPRQAQRRIDFGRDTHFSVCRGLMAGDVVRLNAHQMAQSMRQERAGYASRKGLLG